MTNQQDKLDIKELEKIVIKLRIIIAYCFLYIAYGIFTTPYRAYMNVLIENIKGLKR